MDSTDTVEIVEGALDNIEYALDTVVRVNVVKAFFKKPSVIVGLVAVVSAGGGAAVAWQIVNKKLKTKYEKLSEQEIAEAKTYYAAMHKKDEFADPISALEKYADDLGVTTEEYIQEVAKLGYSASEGPAETEEQLITDPIHFEAVSIDVEPKHIGGGYIESVSKVPVKQNIFANSVPVDKDEFDIEVEMLTRTIDAPYVISHDEFFQNEDDYTQTNLTYYEGDGVLTDERDQTLDDSEGTVGEANLARFGQGSKDRNVVYVRNDRLELNFEIHRSPGKFVEEVLGFIEHSDRRGKSRKFRSDDE